MSGLYIHPIYLLNKLRSWFCISNIEDTKAKITLHETESSEDCYVKPINKMLLMYIMKENNIT